MYVCVSDIYFEYCLNINLLYARARATHLHTTVYVYYILFIHVCIHVCAMYTRIIYQYIYMTVYVYGIYM